MNLFQNNANLTERSLEYIEKRLTLRYLDISSCASIDLEKIKYMEEKYPNLQLIRDFIESAYLYRKCCALIDRLKLQKSNKTNENDEKLPDNTNEIQNSVKEPEIENKPEETEQFKNILDNPEVKESLEQERLRLEALGESNKFKDIRNESSVLESLKKRMKNVNTDKDTEVSNDKDTDVNTDKDTDVNTDKDTNVNTDKGKDKNTDKNTDENIIVSYLFD